MGFLTKILWYELPEEVRNEITMNDLSWDFYGEYFSRIHPTLEANVGYRFNFFECSISKGEISWQFLRDEYGNRSCTPFKYIEDIRRRNYEVFQGMKLFTNDKTLWVSEKEFLKRYRSRIPDTRIGIYDRYVEKYKTIFSWLCIAFNAKRNFGKF
jgi:hypothetical protein